MEHVRGCGASHIKTKQGEVVAAEGLRINTVIVQMAKSKSKGYILTYLRIKGCDKIKSQKVLEWTWKYRVGFNRANMVATLKIND